MQQDVGIKYCNDPNAFIECSNRMDDVYQNIDDYNPIVLDDMITDIMSNKKFQTLIKELFIRCRKQFCEDLQRMHKKTVFFFDN